MDRHLTEKQRIIKTFKDLLCLLRQPT